MPITWTASTGTRRWPRARCTSAGGAPALGVMAVGSRDPNRFYPGMGTLFLRMMGEALTVALQRFEPES